MNIYVKELVELSKIDKDIDSFNPKIEAINSKIKEAQDKVSEIEKAKNELSNLINENSIKIDTYEKHIQEVKEQLEDIKKKSAQVKTEKEVSALSTEEQIAKDKLTYANEEIERLNKINDIKKEELAKLEEELQSAKDALNAVVEESQNDINTIEQQKAELYKKRDEAIRSMDKKILVFYEKIRNWAGNSAVVPVRNQACYGCYMKINDKAYSDLIKGEEIVTCPHCGRVLYIEAQSESVEA